ncbi:hypothetical protein V5799_007303 [Amblyomma americanum]|uniref:Uncharacterized protein n=1 Tax=Amblyomma americanum TaxID=6943 RepID=A0AAQ4DTX5_AMBAM
MFGNAEKLPLSSCRHPHDFVIVQRGRYALLSNTDVLASFIGRNYSYTFCVNSKQTIDFSCYRVSGRNGVTYFVAPTDYDRVLIRGPVSFYKCPQTYEAIYDQQLPLIRDRRQCATFLTVSSYGVRTDSGDCILLYRYALFKDYPEVWNGCQRYSGGVIGNASFDCRFRAAPEPWNYPTREEVSRCAEYAIRVACNWVKLDSKADARYFYAGRGMGEMTQNKMDRKRCQPFSADLVFSSSASWRGGSHYRKTAAAVGGGSVAVVVFAMVLRLMCRMCCALWSIEQAPPSAVECSSVPSPPEPPPYSPPPPSSGSGSSTTVFATPAHASNAASGGVVLGQMHSLFSTPASGIPYGRLRDV